jgi:glycosyltransferase involved in cell wall biosynthesis
VAPGDGLFVRRARDLGVAATVLPFPPALARFGEGGRPGSTKGWRSRLGAAARAAAGVAGAARYVRRLRRLLSADTPDIVHTHGLKMHLLVAAARPRGAALVWHVHDYLGPRPLTRRLMARAARRAAVVIANSESVARDLRAVSPPGAPIRVLHNAVDLRRFSPCGAAADLDALAGLAPAPPGALRVGLVGTFGWWKGHETFLQAVAQVRDLPLRAYVVGGAVYDTAGSQRTRQELEGLAARLGIANRVAYTGFVDDVAPVMRALDIVVHASTEPEPFGMVIAEAMACGRPVIASRAGGAAEIIDDGADAIGHPPGDVDALAGAIRRLAVDPDLRASLGAAARRAAERRFDRARLAAELAPLYIELAGDS